MNLNVSCMCIFDCISEEKFDIIWCMYICLLVYNGGNCRSKVYWNCICFFFACILIVLQMSFVVCY
ncbi:hypothetical protein SAGO17_0071 [Mimivirus AB-566-O17]|uniref:Uncharacterized protein n=1 Tax=Mimivirus AB-566-O17 TaxID=1988039 RepID=A0A1X9VNU9_9VIRU|nr:hypothetical protein SAGO17_0071 [Mimivirus AB-566-O17]